MRMRYIVVLGLFGGLVFTACSTSVDEKTKATNVAASNTNTNTTGLVNGLVSAGPAVADSNAVNSPPAGNIQLPETLQRKIEEMKKSGGTENVDPAAVAAKNARPAPENSTFTSYLAEAGYEIRTFKNHPKLLKVEKKTANDGTQTLKVFMRGGRVVDLPGQAINPLSTAPSEHILNAVAGVEARNVQAGPPPARKPTN